VHNSKLPVHEVAREGGVLPEREPRLVRLVDAAGEVHGLKELLVAVPAEDVATLCAATRGHRP
jgi:hypothetical protein